MKGENTNKKIRGERKRGRKEGKSNLERLDHHNFGGWIDANEIWFVNQKREFKFWKIRLIECCMMD